MKTRKNAPVVILTIIALVVAIIMTTIDVLKSGDMVGLKTWGIFLGIFGLGFSLFIYKMADSLLKATDLRKSEKWQPATHPAASRKTTGGLFLSLKSILYDENACGYHAGGGRWGGYKFGWWQYWHDQVAFAPSANQPHYGASRWQSCGAKCGG